jgi:hypothetical protein
MKTLTLLSLLLLVSCNGGAGSSATTSASSPTNSNVAPSGWVSRTDSNVQHITYDVTAGGMSYYSSTNHFADGDVWTIPEYINIDNDSLNEIQSDDYIELQIANRTTCRYNKVTNYFQFSSCSTVDSLINWTINANDSYYQSDLNSIAQLAAKDNVIMVLQSNTNTIMNGHITFSYDL